MHGLGNSMLAGVLFSGGKDSCLALQMALEQHDVACLLTVFSENKESYMFHTANIEITKLQAKAIGMPQLIKRTAGEKERELLDLEKLIEDAKAKFKIEAIVSGAIASTYQSSRIEKICKKLGLSHIAPLWGMNQIDVLKSVLEKGFEVIITAIAAYPLGESWLGKRIDDKTVLELENMWKKFCINPAGEGGELETLVLDAPIFKRRIEIIESEKHYKNNTGLFRIKKARLVCKQPTHR